MNSRQETIVRLLQEKDEIDVGRFVKELAVSEATIRRDLSILEEIGVLTRTFGGARLQPSGSLITRIFDKRLQEMKNEKERIALEAVKFAEPDMVVALDSGTTVWRVAVHLEEKAPLTVLTNSLTVVEELGETEGITIHCAGGTFRREQLEFVGPSVAPLIRGFHADIAFLSVDSFIPGRGGFARDEQSAEAVKALVSCADKSILVMDNSKFCTDGHFKAFECGDIDTLVTDNGIEARTGKELSKEPFDLRVVEV